jgi:maleylacetoacetate isomerase
VKLYGYFRSSTSYRVRIALNLKGLDYESVPVNLLTGEQHAPAFGDLSPFHSLPVLETEGLRLVQSLAIIDWLDRRYPDPPLYPTSPTERAHCLEMAYAIATDIHGVNNLRTQDRLRGQFGASDDAVKDWYRHWVETTFAPLERMLSDRARPGLPFGAPTLFEIVAVPQIYNAMRYQIDMARYPALAAIYHECLEWPAFQQAAPEVQPDAPYRPTH